MQKYRYMNIKVLGVALFLVVTTIYFTLSNNQIFSAGNEQKDINQDASELIVPTREDIINNGYPVNANGKTYGPNMENLILDEPDLLLAEGKNGVLGYIYPPKSINSLDELDEYNSLRDEYREVPLYLHDGETVIGTFYFDFD